METARLQPKDGIDAVEGQLRALDDPLKVLVEDLLKAHSAGDHKTSVYILSRIQNMVDGVQQLRLEDCIDGARWLEQEPPAPDQIFIDTFDRGDKVAIISSAKSRKSFFLLQCALSIAAGLPFLTWEIGKPRRVFIVQFEVKGDHYHRRVRRMARSLGIESLDLEGNLKILNARGLGLSGPKGIASVGQMVRDYAPEVVFFDPLYKIAEGDENAARDFKPVLQAFDVLAEESNAAISYTHHDAKGWVGERDIRDRGAGSNTLGRDYDACITLTPHATAEDCVVVETLLRNYRPQGMFTAMWCVDDATGGYRFEIADNIMPVKKTSKTTSAPDRLPFETYKEPALALVKNKPLMVTEFRERLEEIPGLVQKKARVIFDWLTSGEHPTLEIYELRAFKTHKKYVGFPADIERLKKENELQT
jgi:hypothetical protein